LKQVPLQQLSFVEHACPTCRVQTQVPLLHVAEQQSLLVLQVIPFGIHLHFPDVQYPWQQSLFTLQVDPILLHLQVPELQNPLQQSAERRQVPFVAEVH